MIISCGIKSSNTVFNLMSIWGTYKIFASLALILSIYSIWLFKTDKKIPLTYIRKQNMDTLKRINVTINYLVPILFNAKIQLIVLLGGGAPNKAMFRCCMSNKMTFICSVYKLTEVAQLIVTHVFAWFSL